MQSAWMGSVNRGSLVWVLAASVGAALAQPAQAPWTQCAGPSQDWTVETSGLADKWPESGPPRLWTREIGEGYSAILADGNRLYTMHRQGSDEVAICLDATSGETVWEHKYNCDPKPGHVTQFGSGPRGTPLLVNGKLFTIGVSGMMHCLDAKSGKPVWTRQLWDDLGGSVLNHGYSSSAIPYKDTIIAMVGGEGHAFVSLKQSDGAVVWQKHDFTNSYSTPKIIDLDGQDHMVGFMADEIVGMDPATGELKWKYDIGNQWKQNVCLPLWGDDNILFFSTSEGGSRGVKLTRDGDSVKMQQLWETRKIQFYHVTAVRAGNFIFGSTGAMDPCFMSCLNVKNGEVAWRERGFSKATCIYADKKLIILDEDGTLALAAPDARGLNVRSKVPLLSKVAWTVPTLSGRTLFVRDQKSIMALDLGKTDS